MSFIQPSAGDYPLPKGENEAVGEPRGEGKSTQVTQLFTLWCIVTGQNIMRSS